MAGRTTRVLDVEDVLWQLENEKFIPEDDSDNDNLENSDFSEEEDILESQSDEVLEDDEPSTLTAPPRRRGGRSAWAGARKRARRSSTTRSGGIRPSYNWTKSFTGRTIRPFEGQRRVRNRQLNENSSAETFFFQFSNSTVVGFIVEMTNLNAVRKLQATAVATGTEPKEWELVTASEIHCFLGLIILMGIIRLPVVDFYWQKKNWLLDIPCFNEIMTRKRFREIMKYLHLCDESSAPDAAYPGKDKLFKILKFLLFLFKGRISFRQFIKTKRARFGIKVWVLAESSTGYVSRLQFYTGKDPTASPENELSSRVVKYLVDPFVGMNYHLYVDNFYTSPKLFEYLLSKGVYACDTFHVNRIGFPKEMIIKRISTIERGTTDWRMAGDLLAQSWVDNRAVYFLTTIHRPEYENNYSGSKIVKRKGGRGRTSSRTAEIPCPPPPPPPVLKDYNTHMEGVDLSDQMSKYYNLTRRSKVWYIRVFSYLVEVSLHNARILAESVQGRRLSGRIVVPNVHNSPSDWEP